ncbi:MAG TPA: MFS transporter [Roseiflexaceae bacterium]|nr:MFS transporter [Roseiflexaceae bacterium]
MEQPLVSDRPIAVFELWRRGAVLALLAGYFGLFGVIIGAQGVLWAELVSTLQLSKSVFGAVQLVSPLLSVMLLIGGGQLAGWAGKKWLALVSLALLAASNLALAGAGGLVGLGGALLLAGAGNALLEMSMNGATLDWERITGRRVMNLMHAGFSGGAVLGALAAGLLLGLGWHYSQVLLALALLCGLVLLATLPVRYPPAEAASLSLGGPGATLRLLLGQRVLIVLAAICVLGIVGESFANLWSVIYLHELGAAALVGGAAFALFNAAMFAGRLGNSWLVERRGASMSLLASGMGMLLSALLLLLPGSVPLAIVAFMLLGVAVAGIVPTVLSAGARLTPGNSATLTGGIMAAAYSGFILCPPLTGWIADRFSLQAALIAVGLSGLIVLWLARRVT